MGVDPETLGTNPVLSQGNRHTLEFQARVAPESVREEKSVAELASGDSVHPAMP